VGCPKKRSERVLLLIAWGDPRVEHAHGSGAVPGRLCSPPSLASSAAKNAIVRRWTGLPDRVPSAVPPLPHLPSLRRTAAFSSPPLCPAARASLVASSCGDGGWPVSVGGAPRGGGQPQGVAGGAGAGLGCCFGCSPPTSGRQPLKGVSMAGSPSFLPPADMASDRSPRHSHELHGSGESTPLPQHPDLWWNKVVPLFYQVCNLLLFLFLWFVSMVREWSVDLFLPQLQLEYIYPVQSIGELVWYLCNYPLIALTVR
jgi:hypothetical protein